MKEKLSPPARKIYESLTDIQKAIVREFTPEMVARFNKIGEELSISLESHLKGLQGKDADLMETFKVLYEENNRKLTLELDGMLTEAFIAKAQRQEKVDRYLGNSLLNTDDIKAIEEYDRQMGQDIMDKYVLDPPIDSALNKDRERE